MSSASTVRQPELAGTWYPEDATECQRLFERFDQDCSDSAQKRTVAGVVPHAGWIYSGRIAYNVLRELAGRAGPIDTVVLFAGHLRPTSDLTVMIEGDCWTPFGALPVDEEMVKQLLERCDLRQEMPWRHSQDNSAEVEFPLIKHFFPEAHLVIIGAPPHRDSIAVADAVVEVAKRLGRSIVALGSTDLTHYGPNYMWTPHGVGAEAERWVRDVNDPLFIEAACESSETTIIDVGLQHQNACCPGAVAAAKRCARGLGAGKGERLCYATSADVHPATSFVGYTGLLY